MENASQRAFRDLMGGVVLCCNSLTALLYFILLYFIPLFTSLCIQNTTNVRGSRQTSPELYKLRIYILLKVKRGVRLLNISLLKDMHVFFLFVAVWVVNQLKSCIQICSCVSRNVLCLMNAVSADSPSPIAGHSDKGSPDPEQQYLGRRDRRFQLKGGGGKQVTFQLMDNKFDGLSSERAPAET